MQGRYAAEHKVSPELLEYISELEDDPHAPVTLSVSFPLIHGSSEGGSAPLDGHDPARAAELEWPAALQKTGLHAAVQRKNPHLVVVATSVEESQVGRSPHNYLPRTLVLLVS